MCSVLFGPALGTNWEGKNVFPVGPAPETEGHTNSQKHTKHTTTFFIKNNMGRAAKLFAGVTDT